MYIVLTVDFELLVRAYLFFSVDGYLPLAIDTMTLKNIGTSGKH